MINANDDVLDNFPNIELSYETVVHKKVYNSTLAMAIPQGRKCFAWFTTTDNNDPVCWLLELDVCRKQIKSIKSIYAHFTTALSYGTVLYGTIFQHKSNRFFNIEDIFYSKGNNVSRESCFNKLGILTNMLQKDLTQIAYNRNFVVFGLPLMSKSNDELKTLIQSSIAYPISHVVYITKHKRYMLDITKFNMVEQVITSSSNSNSNSNSIYIIKSDIQHDIYHVYSLNNTYIGLAGIQEYKTSVLMNSLFRSIKENANLDMLEESDDEAEFEDSSTHKYLNLTKECKMKCVYNNKIKKWIPISVF